MILHSLPPPSCHAFIASNPPARIAAFFRRLRSTSRRLGIVCVLGLANLGCTEGAKYTTPITGEDAGVKTALSQGPITPLCVEGCLDPDPDPNAPGIYIPGTAYTATGCHEYGPDLDYDELSDDCEFQLALAFAPHLSFGYGDEVTRESRFAARWLNTSTVRIIYLLGYWMDHGAPDVPTCFPQFPGCNGHVGDSEYIVLDVTYEPVSHHWMVIGGALSAHEAHYSCSLNKQNIRCVPGNAGTFGGWASGNLSWVGPSRGAPVIHVADGKHANYPTDGACDGGGFFGSDECDSPRWFGLVQINQARNIGSRAHRFVDGVTTSNTSHPVFGQQNVEYYWTWKRFRGWFIDNGDESTSAYSDILTTYGF